MAESRFDLGGRVALVTGAGQNIGRGIVHQLAASGAAVAVNDLRADRAEAVAEEIVASGCPAVAAPFDVGELAPVRVGFASIEATLGPVDIVVNNAGIPAGGMGLTPFREEARERVDDYFRLNAFGPMYTAMAALPHLRDQGWGRLITISSDAHRGVGIGVSLYGASKGAGVAFNRSLALEEASAGITVNTVSLGLFQREAGYRAMDEERIAASVPVGRLGRPDEVGALCVYLASDQAGYLTGQTIELNGGTHTT